jgi:uncharacterized protein (DUF58 family)
MSLIGMTRDMEGGAPRRRRLGKLRDAQRLGKLRNAAASGLAELAAPLPVMDLLDIDLLQRLAPLELRARYVMEGFLVGLHRSPFKGFSVEFAQYRPYLPGDSLRMIDWKLYGRSDRFYIKQFDEDTNLQCHLVLDLSGSMHFRSREKLMTKLDYARTAAAALAYFMHKQRDAVGLTTLTTGTFDFLPARLAPAHLRQVMTKLEMVKPCAEIDLTRLIESFANTLKRRSLVILISDFYEETDALESSLRRLRYDHHDVMALQILDPAEIDFDFAESSLFHDLETGAELPIFPELIQRDYQQRFEKHLSEVREVMRTYDVDFTQIRTDESPAAALTAYLARREGLL